MLDGSNCPPSLSDGYDFTFSAPAPTAVGIDVDGPAELDSNHNAYQSGMSQRCGKCHDRYHDAVGSQNLVSCHRAHASSGPRSGRWDFDIDTWFDEGRLSESWPIPNPYPNTAEPTQKQLCEKCHGASVPNTAPLAYAVFGRPHDLRKVKADCGFRERGPGSASAAG